MTGHFFSELAQDCVCLRESLLSPALRAATGTGVMLVGGIEDAKAPPANQRIDPALLFRIRIRRRIGEPTKMCRCSRRYCITSTVARTSRSQFFQRPRS